MNEANMRSILCALALFAGTVSQASAQQLAAEGRGVLPGPAETPAQLEGTAPTQPFQLDASGTLSRIMFVSPDPKLPITIRQVAIPPDQLTRTLNLAPTAQIRREGATDLLADKALVDPNQKTFAVPFGVPVAAVNRTPTATVLQIITMGAQQ